MNYTNINILVFKGFCLWYWFVISAFLGPGASKKNEDNKPDSTEDPNPTTDIKQTGNDPKQEPKRESKLEVKLVSGVTVYYAVSYLYKHCIQSPLSVSEHSTPKV